MRTFIIGAGFSSAVATAPLMHELWNYFESVYEREKEKKGLNKRVELFEELENFINEIETAAKERFKQKDNIFGGVRENLEYLLTLMDIHHEYSARFEFYKPNADMIPYPVIPLPYTNKNHLERLKNAVSTYLYIIFQSLKENELLMKFSSLVKENDSFINFNYDLLLEKGLWHKKLWSPLNGYIGINNFKYESDYRDLKKASRNTKTYIFKMHGSLMFSTESISNSTNSIKIKLDNKEKGDFFFPEFHDLLSRSPEKNTPKTAGEYAGIYQPHWVFPSFIKTFNSEVFYNIWRSAFNKIRNTEELHIIGYSFRPEDSNGKLLLLNLPKESKVILVDPNRKLKKRIENVIGESIHKCYNSLEHYICDYTSARR